MQTFQKGCPDGFTITYPVTAANFPPVAGSELISPRVGTTNGMPTPPQPGSQAHTDAVDEIVEVRAKVNNGVWPAEFLERWHPRPGYDGNRIPTVLSLNGVRHRDPESLGRLVKMDHPLLLLVEINKWLNGKGVPTTDSGNGHYDFIHRYVTIPALIAGVLSERFERCFECKYFFGSPRIDESLGIDEDVILQYPTPKHCESPAGHGTGAGVMAEYRNHYQLDQELEDEIFDIAYMFAQGRSFSGMHIAWSNLAGMWLGSSGYWFPNLANLVSGPL